MATLFERFAAYAMSLRLRWSNLTQFPALSRMDVSCSATEAR